MEIQPGQTFTHFRFVEQIGEGGMGVVWKALDTRLNREVAVKILPDQFSTDAERLSRFDREAKVLASLNHPGIAAIYGLEEIDGRRLLVMELVPGTNLFNRLSTGPLTVEDAIEIARQIAAALETAHEIGIIHRDLKPANVQVTPDGKVKVLDFGLARALESEISPSSGSMSPTLTTPATRAGVIMGTAAYMSPEQAKGKKVDRRADIWSFGCVLFEMLTGKRPFSGESVTETMAAVLMKPPEIGALPAATPAAVRKLIRRCLEKDPVKRLRDIGEARIILEEILSGAVQPEEAASPQIQATQSGSRRTLLVAGTTLTLAVLATAAIMSLNRPAAPASPVRRFEIGGEDVAGIGPGYNTLAISPDGLKIAWIGKKRIWIRNLDRTEPRAIETSGEAEMLCWSPDSAFVAYASAGKLWKAPAAGGDSALIAAVGALSGGNGATWGQGDRIVFSRGDGGLFETTARGGDPTLLLDLDPNLEQDFHQPRFLPGGKGILFIPHSKVGSPETLVVLAGGTRKLLLHLPGQNLSDPVYAPSGHILFHRAPVTPGIWALPFSLSKLEKTGEPFLVAGNASHPSVSTDGTLVYESGGAGVDSQMVFAGRDGKEAKTVGDPQGLYPVLALSADGRRVAFATAGGEVFNVWIHDVERGTKTRLTFEPGSQGSPAWTRKGDRIAYVTGTTPATFAIWWMPADGSAKPEELTKGVQPSFSPGDEALVYISFDEPNTMSIVSMPLKGERKPVTILKSSARTLDPQVSPDGRFLAYTSDETGRDEVYVTRFPEATGKWQVSVNGGYWPHWGSRGDRMWFAQDDDIMEVTVASLPSLTLGTPRKLFSRDPGVGRTFFGRAPGFDVDATGERFLVLKSVGKGGRIPAIQVVENWYEEFR